MRIGFGASLEVWVTPIVVLLSFGPGEIGPNLASDIGIENLIIEIEALFVVSVYFRNVYLNFLLKVY